MKVEFFTFEQFNGKANVGSTLIRVHQLLKHWPEASLYTYGSKPDVLIYQKVLTTPDYRFPYHFPGVQILDLCDPLHLEGGLIVDMLQAIDAVTCSSDALTTFVQQLTDKPVLTVCDRFDLIHFPPPRQHTESAKTVVWFGYRHNAETLRPALDLINKCGLNLLILSNDDPMVWQWIDRADMENFRYNRYKFVKHSDDPKQLHLDMQAADFAVLPVGTRPVDVFKSNNRTVRATLCGLPVATTADEVRDLIDDKKRREVMEREYERTRRDYDVKLSVQQYRDLIRELAHEKRTSQK